MIQRTADNTVKSARTPYWTTKVLALFDSLSPVTIANLSALLFSLPQNNLACKLEENSEIFPSWGWMSVTSASTHTRIALLMDSCQPQLHQWLEKYWATQVGEQENRTHLLLPLNTCLGSWLQSYYHWMGCFTRLSTCLNPFLNEDC